MDFAGPLADIVHFTNLLTYLLKSGLKHTHIQRRDTLSAACNKLLRPARIYQQIAGTLFICGTFLCFSSSLKH